MVDLTNELFFVHLITIFDTITILNNSQNTVESIYVTQNTNEITVYFSKLNKSVVGKYHNSSCICC